MKGEGRDGAGREGKQNAALMRSWKLIRAATRSGNGAYLSPHPMQRSQLGGEAACKKQDAATKEGAVAAAEQCSLSEAAHPWRGLLALIVLAGMVGASWGESSPRWEAMV